MRILAITKRIMNQFKRDPRTLALMFVAPIVILWLFSIILIDGSSTTKIGLVNTPPAIEKSLKEEGIETVSYINTEQAVRKLKDESISAYIEVKETGIEITLEGSNLSVRQEVLKQVKQSLSKTESFDINYFYGERDMNLFDMIGPAFLGFFAFFFVFILAGIAFIRERLTGTLERILVSPINKIEIVLGYVLGFGIFALIQSVLIVYFTVHILNMYSVGSLVGVMVTTSLISLAALTLGIFLSAFANNEFQIMQFIPLVIVPQLFFTGMFPMDHIPNWLDILGKLFPLTYGAEALSNIMFKGQSLQEQISNLSILLLFSSVFITLNVVVLKKQTK